MPLLLQPMELRQTPSLLRRIVRTTLLALFGSALFILALAMTVLVVTS